MKLQVITAHSPRQNDDEEPDKKKRKTSESEKQEEINFGNVKINLSEEEYTKLKKELNARKHANRNVPRLRLREYGEKASLAVDHDSRTPIFFTDVQHLLMNALIGHGSPCTPERWCWLEKPLKVSHCVTVIVEGMSLYHFVSNESIFKETSTIFDTKLEVIMPKSSPLKELAFVPLTNAQKIRLIEEFGSLEVAVEMNKDPSLIINRIFNIEASQSTDTHVEEKVDKSSLPPADGSVSIKDLVNKKAKVGRTKLLLSALQMVEDDYPLPLRGELSKKYKNFVFSKENYKPVTDESPMFGVDCEMCRTCLGYNELTRISIVNEDHKTIYESLVLPSNKIIDYLTKYSGITPEMMLSVTKDLQTVQREVQAMLPPDAILVGQSLNADLHAMRMFHPYCIDTSVIFNITGDRRRKTKLQTLSKTFLDEIIQENEDGHDSVEDSLASLKLVQMKLVKGLYWGDVILSGKKKANEVAAEKLLSNNFLAHVANTTKHTAIISTKAIDEKIGELIKKSNENSKSDLINVHHIEDSHKKAVEKAQQVVLNNAFTLVNLPVDEENLIATNIEKTCAKIDKHIGKLYTSVAKHGMFVVIFGGDRDSSSGSVKIKIKKRSGDERLAKTSTSE